MGVKTGLLLLAVWAMLPSWETSTPHQASAILGEFSKAWPENRTPHRTEGDTSWKSYALALRAIVKIGDKAVPSLLAGCADKNFQVRALSARALGFLGSKAAVPKLVELLDDPQGPVALLAADALGQIQDPAGLGALEKAKTRLKNGDVLLHVNKALERKTPLEDDVQGEILKLDEKSLDAAKTGRPAPDFSLKDAQGKTWSISEFKGQKSVVLVFMYGDG